MLFLKEIRYRKFNFFLGVAGMVAAVAIVVLFFGTVNSSNPYCGI